MMQIESRFNNHECVAVVSSYILMPFAAVVYTIANFTSSLMMSWDLTMASKRTIFYASKQYTYARYYGAIYFFKLFHGVKESVQKSTHENCFICFRVHYTYVALRIALIADKIISLNKASHTCILGDVHYRKLAMIKWKLEGIYTSSSQQCLEQSPIASLWLLNPYEMFAYLISAQSVFISY
uniref:Uncharacterized protein n=1 Tax=Glossina pallidipes TaxID=7398 RepID=A0A1B0AAN1_GLOPL